MPQVTEFLPQGASQPFLVESIPLATTAARGVFVVVIMALGSVGQAVELLAIGGIVAFICAPLTNKLDPRFQAP